MDQNGDCRDRAVDLESIIDFPQTFSKLTKSNFEKFNREVGDLLSFQDTSIYELDNQDGRALVSERSRFQSLGKPDSKKNEYCLAMEPASHMVRIKFSDNPEYAFAYRKTDGEDITGLFLSTNTKKDRKTTVYLVKKKLDRLTEEINVRAGQKGYFKNGNIASLVVLPDESELMELRADGVTIFGSSVNKILNQKSVYPFIKAPNGEYVNLDGENRVRRFVKYNPWKCHIEFKDFSGRAVDFDLDPARDLKVAFLKPPIRHSSRCVGVYISGIAPLNGNPQPHRDEIIYAVKT